MLCFDIQCKDAARFCLHTGTQNETDRNGQSGTGGAVRVVTDRHTDRQTRSRYPLYLLFCKIKCFIIKLV